MHGNNTRNLPVWLSLSQTSKKRKKKLVSLIIFFFFCKIREQKGKTGLPGVGRGFGTGGRAEVAGKRVGG
jgi:hypothetical protein